MCQIKSYNMEHKEPIKELGKNITIETNQELGKELNMEKSELPEISKLPILPLSREELRLKRLAFYDRKEISQNIIL